MFNLFLLHSREKDKNMRGSLIKAKGENLNKLVKNMIDDLTRAGITKQVIITELSNRLGCHFSTAKRHLYNSCRKNEWVALIFLEELINIWGELLMKSPSKVDKIRAKVISSICFLKVGQANSKPVKAPKKLNVELCKLVGTFAADGSLDRKWRINISDEDLVAIKKAQEWFIDLFGVTPKIRKSKKGNWWELEIYNKVIGRYLHVFFNFPIGKKSLVVDEPPVIKNSKLRFRKAFAAGAFNFDGSVAITGDISYESHSPALINSLEEILVKDEIKVHKLPCGNSSK